jgi:hypothetical protein
VPRLARFLCKSLRVLYKYVMEVYIVIQRAGNPLTRLPMPFDYSLLLLPPEVSILIAVSYRMKTRDFG